MLLCVDDDDVERPWPPRMSEEERRAIVKRRVGISSISRVKLWLERQASNQWAKGVKERK